MIFLSYESDQHVILAPIAMTVIPDFHLAIRAHHSIRYQF